MIKAEEKNRFKKTCEKYFVFLKSIYKMKSTQDADERSVTYHNSTTAIRITYEPRDPGMIYVSMIRLIRGVIPNAPIKITSSSNLNTFDLEDLIALRKPNVVIKRPSRQELAKPFTIEIFEDTLKQLAENLKDCGLDILKGDFAIFADLEKIVKERAKTQV